MKKAVALIPARGGSKGLPGKNIRLLGGKPLIAYSIEAALGCSEIEAVFVSTDDPLIGEAARLAGAELSALRPEFLSTDTATTQAVVCHFLDWFEETYQGRPETLVLLQPTSPLRTELHLKEALYQYQTAPLQPCSVVSVMPAKPIAWQGAMDVQDRFQPHDTSSLERGRQQEPTNYALNGAIYITTAQRFYDGHLMQQPVYPYIMPVEASVDIDTLLDFELADFWLKRQQDDALICASPPSLAYRS